MKHLKLIITIGFLSHFLLSHSQIIHKSQVVGVINIGQSDVASILDIETGELYKTIKYQSGLLIIGEDVELDFLNNNSNAEQGKVIKPNLNNTIMAFRVISGGGPIQIGFRVCCDIAKPSSGCKDGGGLCNCRIGRKKCADRPDLPDNRIASSNFNVLNDTQLEIDFLEKLPLNIVDTFEFDEDNEIINAVANFLGYKSIIMYKGIYKIDYSDNPFGKTIVAITGIKK